MASPMTIPAFIAFIGHVSGTISMLDSVLGSVLILIGSMLVQVPIVLCANSIKPLLLRGNTMKYINILCGVAIMIYSIYAVVSLIH
jgi:threonine/homoserine/homoserine lactone efflux protein